MRRLLILFLLLMPVGAMAAENLMEIISGQNATIVDGVLHQTTADGMDQMRWKIQAIFNNQQHLPFFDISYESLAHFFDDNIGLISYQFTTPDDLADLSYFRFGLNGNVRDTLVIFNIKDVMPNTTYTLQWRMLNNVQGEIAWTDMFLTHCGDGYSLALGDETCSRVCENQSVTGGHIPPDVARVYEPATCTYDPANLVCDAGYNKIGNTCAQICAAGISRLYIGGAGYGLYAQKSGTPSLHVRYNDTVCYGHLAVGHGDGLNINVNGTVYHLID